MIPYDSGIKHAGMLLYAYIVFCIAMPDKFTRCRYMAGGVAVFVTGASMTYLMTVLSPMTVPVMIIALFLITGVLFRQRPGKNLTLTLISYGLSFGAFYISIIITSAAMLLLSYATAGYFGSPHEALDYYTSATISTTLGCILMMTGITLMQGLIILTLLLSRRIRRGISTLVRFGMSDVGVYISIATISVLMTQVVATKTYGTNTVVFTVCFFAGTTCIFLLYYWIKDEIRSAYKNKVKENELLLLERSISEKDKLIDELRSDNEQLSAIIHKDNKLIPAMVMSVRKYAADMQRGSFDSSGAMETAEALESIYSERVSALSQYESHCRPLAGTGVTAVDAVLLYMAAKAEESGIDFELDVSGDLSGMFTGTVDRREFNTMLADLAENAIISAKQHLPGKVAVNIRNYEGNCCLEVLDSGDEFNEDVLRNMGVKKITTHKSEGGTGTGLMTLIRIIKHNNASLTIEEFPQGKRYSKAVRVTFDGKGRRRILTYRAQELKKAIKYGSFDIALPEKNEQEETAV